MPVPLFQLTYDLQGQRSVQITAKIRWALIQPKTSLKLLFKAIESLSAMCHKNKTVFCLRPFYRKNKGWEESMVNSSSWFTFMFRFSLYRNVNSQHISNWARNLGLGIRIHDTSNRASHWGCNVYPTYMKITTSSQIILV